MSDAVVLRVRGLGHTPSFKNKKRICGKNLITSPDAARWMEAAIRSLQSQLRSGFLTTGEGTSTAISAPVWIALSEHSKEFDDSHSWLPKLVVEVEHVAVGEEGADIEIRLL